MVPNKVVLFVDDNKMDTMEFDLDAAKWAALPGTVLPSSGSIVIIPDRTEDTPKTDDQQNRSTDANDVVAAAGSLMAVAALGMHVLTRKTYVILLILGAPSGAPFSCYLAINITQHLSALHSYFPATVNFL